jgi:hypothetical protein
VCVGEQPNPWLLKAPVVTQLLEQGRRQDHMAVFTTFTLFDAQKPSFPIDMLELELNQLADTQPTAITG